jgi:hypothetical protein
MSHVWPDGLPLEVVCDELGAPQRLRLRGGWHSVAEVAARWRVRKGWWRAGRWREYITVATTGRLLLTLARELPDGGWELLYLHD